MNIFDDQIRRNGGYFTRGEALDSGETDATLRMALRDGVIVRLRRGIYARREDVPADDPYARHLLLARAALATQRGQVALFGPSAAVLHGFRLYGHDLDVVHLIRLDGGSPRREAGIVHHVAKAPISQDVVSTSGVLTLNPARTVWEVARMSSLEGGVCTADSAIALVPGIIEGIRELAGSFAFHPGSRGARIALLLARPGSESVGESYTRVQFYRAAIPAPELQHRVLDRNGRLIAVSDFYWAGHRHLGEFDGKIKYQKLLRPGETPSDCVFREKQREDAMRAAGCGMTRFVWSDVMPGNVRQTMERLRHELEQSRRLYVRGSVA